MKKLLLTLLLLLSLGFAASAAEMSKTFDFSTNSYGMVNEQYLADGYTLTEDPVVITLNKNAGSNGFRLYNNALRFHKNSNSSMTIAAGGATITKIVLTVNGAGFALDSSSTGTWSNNTWTGSATSVKLNYTTNGNKDVNKIVVTYDQGQTEAIELSEDNILIEDHNGQPLVGGASYEYEAGAKINFNYSYTGNVANPEINYSYSVNDGEAVEGNEYTYDGNGDVTLKMMVTSGENTVSKTITILKKYPTVCPDPVFSVENGAELSAGKTVTVSCEEAKTLTWTVNGVNIEGDTYTITEAVGTQLNFEATATIDGRLASGELGELSSTATLVVNVVESTGYTIVFKSNSADATSDLTNNNFIDQVTEGANYISSVSGISKVYSGKNGLKFSAGRVGGNITINLSDEGKLYCKAIVINAMRWKESEAASISVNGESSQSVSSSLEDYTFELTSPADLESIVLNASGRLYVKSITVVKAPAPVPTLALSRVEITHGKVAGVVTIDYTFEIANHNGNEVEVTATIDGMDIVFEKVPAPAAAPARAAGENAIFSGILKAKHDDLKGEQPLSINVKATLDGNDLYNETHTNFQTTGIEDVTVEGGEAAEYFNLQGIRVAEPQAGQVYIVRRGAKTTKELVK